MTDLTMPPGFAPVHNRYVLPSFVDPWYDEGSIYTVPYTVFSSGIGYRTDRIDPAKVEEMGWEILWDPTHKGVTSILDDYREGIALALLRRGITDVNTTDRDLIEQAGADLEELVGLMNIKVNIEAYKDELGRYFAKHIG